MIIESAANPQIKRVAQLNRDARARRKEVLFVAEGERLVREVPEALLAEVFLAEGFAAQHPECLERAEAAGAQARMVRDELFAKISDTKSPQGVLALVRMPEYEVKDWIGGATGDDGTAGMTEAAKGGESVVHQSAPNLLVALENIQDPGNVGTILRTAEAAGATGALLSEGCADVFSPKVVRGTMGAIFRVPFRVSEDFYADLAELRARGARIVAATLDGSVDYREVDYSGGAAKNDATGDGSSVPTDRAASGRSGAVILIGNEANGLSDEALALADVRVRIPMEGRIESLNAGVAAALLLYEARR